MISVNYFQRKGNAGLKKILSMILACCFALSSALVIGASAFGNANVMKVKNNFEFARISADIVYSYKSNSYGNGEQGHGETLRVLGRTTDASYNFRRLGAEKCVIGADGRFLLQFNEYSGFRYALGILKNDEKIVYAEPDTLVCISSESDSESGNLSWGTEALGLDKYSEYIAQNVGASAGVTVAVVDTGVEDIDPLKNRLVDGYDFIENDSDAFEDTSEDSHGTFVAGIIADCTRNTSVKIMPVRVIESKEAYLSLTVNGIYYAVDSGANVINLSLNAVGGQCTSLDEAVEYADKNNVVVVTCSGNLRMNTNRVCPAHIESAITVSAINEELEFSLSYSGFGKSVDVAAPGDNIVSYGAHGNLRTLSGTSMSAAFISAGAALFLLQYPSFSPFQVQASVKNVCTDLGIEGADEYYGSGIPDFSEFIDNYDVAVRPVGIHIEKSPDKVKYTYKSGETLDLSGIQVVVTYSDSSTKLVEDMQNVTVSGFSTSTAGKQTVTVEYGGFTDDFEITVGYTWWQMIIRILLLGFLWY